MRIFTRTYGAYPKISENTVMAFTADLTRADGDSGDLTSLVRYNDAAIAPLSMTSGTAPIVDCPAGVARHFNDHNNYLAQTAAGGDHAQLTGELTWQCWMYVDSTQYGGTVNQDRHYAWMYATHVSDAQVENCLMSVQISAPKNGGITTPSDPVESIGVFWEKGPSGGSQNIFCDSSQPPPVDQWFHFAAVRADDPNNAGKCTLKMYINGCQMRDASGANEEFINLDYPDGGTSSRWGFGNFNGVPTTSGYWFKGRVGPALVSTDVYTQERIAEDYRRGCGTATNNRVYAEVITTDPLGNDYYNAILTRFVTPSSPRVGSIGEDIAIDTRDTVDVLQSVRIDDSVDNRVATASVNVYKNYGKTNLSPYASNSFTNRRTSPLGSTSTMASRQAPSLEDTVYFEPNQNTPTSYFKLGQRTKIYFARMPYGKLPYRSTFDAPGEAISSSGWRKDFETYFDGYVDAIDIGDDIITLKLRDKGMILADTFIESDDQRSSERFVDVGDTLYTAINNVIFANNWVNMFGTTSSPTLFEPISSDWEFGIEGTIDREGLLSAANKLSAQIGWMVKYKWAKHFGSVESSPGSGVSVLGQSFLPTLMDPERDKKVCDSYLSTEDYTSITKLSLDLSGVRNAVRVYYWEPGWGSDLSYRVENVDAVTMAPNRLGVTDDDTTSQSKYGRRFMEVQEDKSSLINSLGEAERMAEAIVKDLAEPLAQSSIAAMDMVEVELNDMIMVEPDNIHSDVPLYMAATTISTEFRDGMAKVDCGLRQRPSSGGSRHIASSRTGNSGAMFRAGLRDGRSPTLSAIANAIDRLHSIAQYGGISANLNNANFNQNEAGSQVPPIGWTMSGGTWGSISSGGNMYLRGNISAGGGANTIDGVTGNFVLQIPDTAGEITSPQFPVSGGKGYILNLRYGWDAAPGTATIQVDIGYQCRYGGSTVTNVSPLALVQQTSSTSATKEIFSKQIAISSVPTTLHADAEIGAGTYPITHLCAVLRANNMGTASKIYIDSIELTPAEPTCRRRPAADVAISKITYTAAEVATTTSDFDVGDMADTNGVLIKEAGFYDVKFNLSILLVSNNANINVMEGPGATNDTRLCKGEVGMYGGVWINYSSATPEPAAKITGAIGQFVKQSSSSPYYYRAVSSGSGRLYLEKGDYLTLRHFGTLFHNDNTANAQIKSENTFLEVSKASLFETS
ncbi:MAG: hypothetical protein GOVbin406_47 [Prokaryotic dsDNA virus sp.]|nr:MAG: hypothetical protein GOVbin406_47 [Prokaryotic dsDNA virus sp.]